MKFLEKQLIPFDKKLVADVIALYPEIINNIPKIFIPAFLGLTIGAPTSVLRWMYQETIFSSEPIRKFLQWFLKTYPNAFDWSIWTGPDIGFHLVATGSSISIIELISILTLIYTKKQHHSEDVLICKTLVESLMILIPTFTLLADEFQQLFEPNKGQFSEKDVMAYFATGIIFLLTTLIYNLSEIERVKTHKITEKNDNIK